jgi:hypothetical protein
MQYRVLIEQDEDGVYVAEVPALPGCISQGKTRSEVVAATVTRCAPSRAPSPESNVVSS